MNMVGSGTTDLVLLVRRFPVPDRDPLKGMECAPRQRMAVRAIKIKDRAANDFFFGIAQRGRSLSDCNTELCHSWHRFKTEDPARGRRNRRIVHPPPGNRWPESGR